MKKRYITFILYFLAVFAVVIVNFPIFFMILTSFKKLALTMVPKPIFIFKPVLENYKLVLSNPNFPFWHYIRNSLIVSLSTSILSIVLAVPCVYGLSRFKIKRDNLSFWILSIRMAPPLTFALPIFLILKYLKMTDTISGLIFSYFTFSIPLAVWILNTFILEVPYELEEAALIDGASRGKILISIIFPLLKPGLVAVFILNFIFAWNEFFFALLFTLDNATTLTVGAARFVTGYSIHWGAIASASTIAMIPMIILTFLIQKYLVRGLTMGAIK